MNFSYNHNDSLGYLTGLASRLFNQLLASRYKQAGIDMTAEQWGAIILLLNEQGMSQSEMAKRLCLEKSSLSRLVDGLERRGWAQRSKDLNDSRRRIVSATDKAFDTAEFCANIARSTMDEVMHNFTADQRQLAQLQLGQIITNLREIES